MDFIVNFPFFSIVASLFAAVITSVLGRKAARVFAPCVVFIVLGLSAATLCYTLATGEAFTYQMGHFPAPWGNEIRAGMLEGLLATVFGGVLLTAMIGGTSHMDMDIEPTKINLFYVMLLMVQAALLAMIYTNDLFTGYVFLEISTLASCGLLMIRQVGRTTIAAIRYMVFNLLGSGLFLIGVCLLYDITGHLLMPNLGASIAALTASGEYAPVLNTAIALIALGLSLKSGLFPFHFWMPDTYGYATTTSSAVLSGLVSKGYIVLLIKIVYRVIGLETFAASPISTLLMVLGLIGIVVGSLSAMKENNINRMIAFSSAAQIGYIYLGIGMATQAGMTAAIFHILTHSVTKALLFLCAARLVDVSGNSKRFRDLQGAGRRNQLAGLAFSVGAMSMVGLPAFAGFVSKLLFASAALQTELLTMLPTLIVLAVSTVLNAVYFLRTVIRIYMPGPVSDSPPVTRTVGVQKSFAAVAACLVGFNLVLGLYSRPIIALIEKGLAIFG